MKLVTDIDVVKKVLHLMSCVFVRHLDSEGSAPVQFNAFPTFETRHIKIWDFLD